MTIPARHLAIFGVAILAAGGCGSDRPQTIPVGGTITFDGGPPPAPGTLYLTTNDPAEGFPIRPATAEFDADGRFAAKTWDSGDGMMPGRYKITVECWEVPPTMGGPPSKSYVPPKYESTATSPLEIALEPGDDEQVLQLDVKSDRQE
jgi:hypothetical protein